MLFLLIRLRQNRIFTEDKFSDNSKMLLVVTLLFISVSCINGARILMLPMIVSGHLTEHAAVADGLIKRGHEVYVVTDEHYPHPPHLKYVTGLKYVHYRSPNHTMAQPDVLEDTARISIFQGISESAMAEQVFRPKLHYDAYNAVTNEELFEKLKKLKFDFAVCDGLFFAYQVIPYRLGIPYASMSTQLYSHILRMHPYATVLPCIIIHEGNTIWNRLQVLMVSTILHALPEKFIHEEEFIAFLKSKGHNNVNSLRELATKSNIWLQNQSPYLDCPRMSMPNVILIGGLAGRPPKSLQGEIKSEIEAAENGAIIMSFGSVLSSLTDQALENFLQVFRQIPQTVFWRLRLSDIQKEKFKFPKNVKIKRWLPQSDILGHPNTKLFITHCGTNGQAEALYNSVPMIGFPMFADQHYNCYRAKVKGFAECFSLLDFNPAELLKAINSILNNPKYKQKIEIMSKLHRAQEAPRDTAARWIEHVIDNGSEHLQTPVNKMSVFEFLMLDLFLIALVVCMILIMIVYFVMKCALRMVCAKPDAKKTKTS